MRKVAILMAGIYMIATGVQAAEIDHSKKIHNNKMTHSEEAPKAKEQRRKVKVSLLESGTDQFAVIQEVIKKLEANPNTDWEKVNLEALRGHLVEMEDMTLNVSVEQTNIENGLKAIVTPITERAYRSMEKVLSAHPEQMNAETGWVMTIKKKQDFFELNITADNEKDIYKIRGLGYIGIMAYGNHHQPHHWAMATGSNPHSSHKIKH